jgi:hypothetical protein
MSLRQLTLPSRVRNDSLRFDCQNARIWELVREVYGREPDIRPRIDDELGLSVHVEFIFISHENLPEDFNVRRGNTKKTSDFRPNSFACNKTGLPARFSFAMPMGPRMPNMRWYRFNTFSLPTIHSSFRNQFKKRGKRRELRRLHRVPRLTEAL